MIEPGLRKFADSPQKPPRQPVIRSHKSCIKPFIFWQLSIAHPTLIGILFDRNDRR